MNAIGNANTLAQGAASPQPTLSQQLSTFACGLSYESIPANVRERAKYMMLDAVGVALASTHYDFSRVLLEGIRSMAEGGDCSIIGMPGKLPLRDAVLMNGALIHGLDYDDSHLRAVLHPSVTAFITALGVCEKRGLSGRDLLTGYVLGVEMVTRIAAAAKGGFHHYGFHPTGLVGHFSCAITVGKLYGLTAQQITMAQGLAGSTAAGTQEFLEEGAWNKRLHPGWAAVGGITAASLARAGAIGPTKPYEGRLGIFNTHLKELAKQIDYSEITKALGEKWEVMEIAVKPFPVCHFIHACGDAALILRERHAIKPEEIESIKALVAKPTMLIIAEPAALKKRPANDYDAKFSVHYLVAACLARGKFGLAELEADVRNDDLILALAQKVEAIPDPDSLYPGFLSGGVIIRTKDGKEFRHYEPINRGAGDRALTGAEIEAKYLENARMVLSEKRAQDVRDAVLNLDKHDACVLARNLAGQG